ncbi:MAG TPA: DinB family protein [Terriglobales bacterium]|nr:DinB family protein [Terriglobales bacterium]
MNRDDLLRMFAYDHWANGECLRALRNAAASGKDVGPIVKRIAHILSAEKLWLERMRRVPQTMAVWPGSTLEECEALATEMGTAWKKYLEKLSADGLAEVVDYKNSKGEPWQNHVEDVLTHVVMHSAYHRGQIAMEMRAAGMEPAYTDFIHAVRQEIVQ